MLDINVIEDFVQNIVDKLDEIVFRNTIFFLRNHNIASDNQNFVVIKTYYGLYIRLYKNDVQILGGVDIKDFAKYDIENDYFQLSTIYPFSKQLYLNVQKIRSFFIEYGVLEKTEEFD